MQQLAHEIAKEIAEKIESPFYSDIDYMVRQHYKGGSANAISKRHLLFNKVHDILRNDYNKKIWS